MSKRDLYIKAKSTGSAFIGWQRPSDWLPMPTVTSADDIFVGLHAIFPSGNNFAAFRFTTSTGNYQVDWGDGTVTTHASNTIAEHTYDYTTYDTANATLSSRGYKQVIIIVTPVSGLLRTASFQLRRTTTPAQNQSYATGFLDCILSMPNANTGQAIQFGGTTVRHSYCERFELKSIGSCTILQDLFYECDSLESVLLPNTSNVQGMANMFRNCSSLKEVPLFDTSSATSMNAMFSGCRALRTIPLFNTQNVTNTASMFGSCAALQSVPLLNTQNVTSMVTMFLDCFSIQEIPAFNTSSVTNMTQAFQNCRSLDRTDIVCPVSVNFQNCQLSQSALVNIFNNLIDRSSTTAANINISGNWGASALTTAERDIALNKNWTITG
jgi:surface protein